MTKQELINLIEDSGELVTEEYQLHHQYYTKYLFDEEHISSLADEIIKHQNEQSKGFVYWCLKNYDEQIAFWKNIMETVEYKDTAIEMLNDTRNEKSKLIAYYQKFLEETSDDNK